jgi:glucose/arabinose dehydrogenase
MRLLKFAALILLVQVSIACDKAPTGKGEGEIATTSAQANSNSNANPASTPVSFRIETVASNLEVPWSIVFTPDGRLLFTERAGRVRVIENGALRPEPLVTISEVAAASESGLMGMALHPQFRENRFLYLAYAYRGSGGQRVRVARYKETASALVEPKTIIEEIPAAPNHAGCRLGFGPDGKLYITTGDATDRRLAQQMDSLAGKTLRLNDDGSVPADNPFAGQAGARPEIWSYGHRNAQGIDWQPVTGLMFQTEHGPSGFDGPGGGDEVNIVERGKNYGWPLVHHRDRREGTEPPLLEYTPAVAPASGMFYRGALFPDFRGNYFFGCLRGKSIIRVVMEGRNVVSQERLLQDSYGRIREVAEGPDGIIYFSTSNRDGRGSPADADDRILRLVPVK